MPIPLRLWKSRHAFSRSELLFSLAAISALGVLLLAGNAQQDSTAAALALHAKMIRQVMHGRTIFDAMNQYDTAEGAFPLYADVDDPTTKVKDSNAAIEILLKRGFLDDKKVCFNADSAWCQQLDATKPGQVLVGENDWCYVAGLARASAIRFPLLMNAFVPGTTFYSADPVKKGGVWRGTKAVVVYGAGNGEIIDTLAKDDGIFIVRRPDRLMEDTLVPDGAWLAGANVRVLYPRAR